MTEPYYTLPGFENVYLEDSWVLGVTVTPRAVDISAEIVLTEDHPAYADPRPGERYCYAQGRISFSEVNEVVWRHMTRIRPTVDPDGSIDYGNFDQFQVDGRRYILAGDFGAMEIEADSCELTLDE